MAHGDRRERGSRQMEAAGRSEFVETRVAPTPRSSQSNFSSVSSNARTATVSRMGGRLNARAAHSRRLLGSSQSINWSP